MDDGIAVDLLGGPNTLGSSLERDLRDTRALRIAVAYAKESALDRLDLERWCGEDRELSLLAGTDFFLTELPLLRRLEQRPHVACRIYHPLQIANFHPKVYVLDKGESIVAYVGSSNLTRGGLVENVEANVRIEAPRGAEAVQRPLQFFEKLFASEFATGLDDEFERRYQEMQEAQRRALGQYPTTPAFDHLRVAEQLLVSAYRSRNAHKRWLLVVTPENYEICMRTHTWGHQREHEVRAYRPGDVLLFHVTGRSRIAALGMFTGEPYHDPDPLWRNMGRGSFPWRIRFVSLGKLLNGIPTKDILDPLRRDSPKHWFHGFIQASHSLDPSDFATLRDAFEAALRREAGLAA